jgi:uncharacterized SAM-binding protein YcdF (DUF218 family)
MTPPSVDSFDAAIVLGATVAPDGSPSPAMVRRVARAVELARGNPSAHLLMSGGPVRHPVPEARIMRELAVAAGIEPNRVLIEDRSRNTIGNALYSRPIIRRHGWTRLLLVTDACHIPRSLYVFRRFGLTVGPAPAMPIERAGPEWWLAWLRELAALPWTVIRVERIMWSRR